MTKEAAWGTIQSDVGPLNEAEQRELKVVLSHPLLIRAMGLAYKECQGKPGQFLTLDFSKQEAILEAIKMQGECIGFTRAYEALLDLAGVGPEEQ